MGQLSAFSHEEQHGSVKIKLLPKVCVCGYSLEGDPGVWGPYQAFEFGDPMGNCGTLFRILPAIPLPFE